MHRRTHIAKPKPLKGLFALACVVWCVSSAFAARATMSSVADQGYIFLHPMFRDLPWESTLNRLDLAAFPDTLLRTTVRSFAVSEGADNAIAVFTTASNDLFIMPVLYEKLAAPCYDHALTFDDPRKVTPANLAVSGGLPIHVVRDSLYARDSVRVVLVAATVPLRLLVATIRASTASVTRIDTITLAQRRTGQQVLGVSGAPDSITRQDRGIWVTGTNGLVRYVPYTNHRFGNEAVRDLGEATVSVTHTDGTFAVTTQGRIFKRNPADTFFTFVAAASGALYRAYPQGVIGNNGVFKEYAGNVWRADRNFGDGAFRFANFIRRPGGLGIELLDTAWAYAAYTIRDTSSRIVATSPASLSTNINGLPYVYNDNQQLDLTVMLDDPDSNFSDYTLTLVSGASSTDLKNDGTYAIRKLDDSATCHIGSLKMTSGRLRLTLAAGRLTVRHDCGLGALDPTCLTCYWKKYDFALTKTLRDRDTIRIATSQHLLRIAIFANVTLSRSPIAVPGVTLFPIRFSSGYRCNVLLPVTQERFAVAIAVHDLDGRRIAEVPVGRNQRFLELPGRGVPGVAVVTCVMNDGTVVRSRVTVSR